MRRLTLLSAFLLTTAAQADVPYVATDILPVQGLTAMVMGDLGAPTVTVRPGVSPHGYAMRPTDAATLERSDLVIWVGPLLTPWLGEALTSLAPDAAQLVLLDAPGTTLLEQRGWGDGHDHSADDHGAHDDHDDHDDHAINSPDPHAWLDPENAKTWLTAIAGALSEKDPENAATYHANAVTAAAQIDAAAQELQAAADALNGAAILVYHDAFQYLETRFRLNVLGSIAAGDSVESGPKHLLELQQMAQQENVRCVMTEPQYSDRRITSIFGADAMPIATLDPLGTNAPVQNAHYPELLRNIADALSVCR